MVVDDEAIVRDLLADALTGWGFRIKAVPGGHEALIELQKSDYSVMLTDIAMPGMNGHELLHQARVADSSLQIILITGSGSISSAVRAMKDGAFEYVTKPFNLDELRLKIERALEERALKVEDAGRKQELRKGYDISAGERLVGASAVMHGLRDTIAAVSRSAVSVLIGGQTGTGKELVAKAIHYSGSRARKPFIPINCGSMSRSLLESQLFGHLKGAFTSAIADSPGFFVAADGGTLFLDEVTELDFDLQSKLLRAVQEREVTPLGGTRPRPVDVRIIAATNRDAKQAMSEGRLRNDLYYRLGVVIVTVPPLRERREDIAVLAEYFNRRFAARYGVAPRKLASEALERFQQYDWPGNVRELENVIERAFALSDGNTIGLEDLPEEVRCGGRSAGAAASGIPTLAHSERMLVERAVKESGGNKAKAARILGVGRRRLYRLLKKHGLC